MSLTLNDTCYVATRVYIYIYIHIYIYIYTYIYIYIYGSCPTLLISFDHQWNFIVTILNIVLWSFLPLVVSHVYRYFQTQLSLIRMFSSSCHKCVLYIPKNISTNLLTLCFLSLTIRYQWAADEMGVLLRQF